MGVLSQSEYCLFVEKLSITLEGISFRKIVVCIYDRLFECCVLPGDDVTYFICPEAVAVKNDVIIPTYLVHVVDWDLISFADI